MGYVLQPGTVRLILALFVAVSHVLMVAGHEIYPPLDGMAVYCFFFLSGYWIKKLWDDKYVCCKNPLLTFYLSRMLRLFPCAVLAIGVMLSIDGSSYTWNEILLNVSLVAVNNTRLIVTPTWSLGIEVQFYLLAPFLWMLMKSRATTLVLVSIAAVLLILRTVHVTDQLVIFYLLLFLLGALAVELRSVSKQVAYGSVAGFLALYGIASANSIRGYFLEFGISAFQFAKILHLVFTLAIIPYLLASLQKRSTGLDRIVGDLAYPVYLFHWPAIYMAAKVSQQNYYLSVLAITAVLTAAYNVIFERRINRLRTKFLEARRVPVKSSMQSI